MLLLCLVKYALLWTVYIFMPSNVKVTLIRSSQNIGCLILKLFDLFNVCCFAFGPKMIGTLKTTYI